MNKKMLLIAMFASMGSGLMAPPKADKDGYYAPDEYTKQSENYKKKLGYLQRMRRNDAFLVICYENLNYDRTKNDVPKFLQKHFHLRGDGCVKEFNEEEYLPLDPKERKMD
ncbi:hypothetical protein [Alphaproteobacteria bacterium endosymbiont of Tiliacea citrago]|uniref:hypothetical protein n=1 Tax=Alphaproteobacteria bacterium endosymbiont of Tiliacea citrago TaxID=3077944 RepID=UPI00313B1008